MHICIIGAGLSGLVTARVLRHHGHDVTVFEKSSAIGGVWNPANRYVGLRTQSPRDCYAFSDFPMPRDYPEFPSGEQVHRYLSAYAQQNNLNLHIRLNAAVKAITRQGQQWQISFRTADGAESAEIFDYVVCCNGVFSQPTMPALPGQAAFETNGGVVLHSSRAHDLDALRARDVTVVGFGKSALDIAEAALPVARSTTIVCHRTLWKVPRYLFGVFNAKHLILSRSTELWLPHYSMKGFRRFLHQRLPILVDAYWLLSERIMGRMLGLLRADLRPEIRLQHSVGTCFGLAPSDNFRALREGRIGLVKGRLAGFDANGLLLADGRSVPAQTIVFATGFKLDCEFLAPAHRAALFDSQGVPQLYRLLVCPDIPALAFNGYNGGGVSQLTAEIGARWIAEMLAGKVILPDVPEMKAQVQRDLAQWQAVVRTQRGLGFYASPFTFSYLDQLLQDMGRPPADAGKNLWRRLFRAVEPSDYAERPSPRPQHSQGGKAT